MTLADVAEFVKSVGFPIAVAGFVLYRVDPLLRGLTVSVNTIAVGLTGAVNALTLAVTTATAASERAALAASHAADAASRAAEAAARWRGEPRT